VEWLTTIIRQLAHWSSAPKATRPLYAEALRKGAATSAPIAPRVVPMLARHCRELTIPPKNKYSSQRAVREQRFSFVFPSVSLPPIFMAVASMPSPTKLDSYSRPVILYQPVRAGFNSQACLDFTSKAEMDLSGLYFHRAPLAK
jgi:hypothetical protein